MNKNESKFDEGKIMLMDMKTGAARLGICYRTMQELVYQRKIGFIQVGRHIKFRIEDLEEFILRNRIKPVK